jgi:hypothetical protein
MRPIRAQLLGSLFLALIANVVLLMRAWPVLFPK